MGFHTQDFRWGKKHTPRPIIKLPKRIKPGQTRFFRRFFFRKNQPGLFFPRRKSRLDNCQKITQTGQIIRNNRVHQNNPPGYFLDFFPRRFFRLGKNNPPGYFLFGPRKKTGFEIAPICITSGVLPGLAVLYIIIL